MKRKNNYISNIVLKFLLFALIFSGCLFSSINVQAASLNKTKSTMNVGDTLQLKVSGASSVSWKSTNKKVAVVSSEGLVTPKAKGTATIKASAGGKTLTCKITVRAVYSFSRKSKLIDVGGRLFSTYGSSYVNKYTRDWYLFRSYLEKLETLGGGTLIVKKGTYNVTNTMCIPSNVNLIFEDGVTINKINNTHTNTFHAGVTMFEIVPVAKYHSKNWSSKYNGAHNVKILGKGNVVINQKSNLYTVGVTMCHNQNIVIDGITFKNVNESHFIELDASKNVTISNCSFTGMKGSNSYREAINVDTPDDETDGFHKDWAKNDKTPNNGVVIKNCNFTNMYVGIGTHRDSQNKKGVIYHKNITVKNCSFDNMTSCAINGLAWAKTILKDNTFTNCSSKTWSLYEYDEARIARENALAAAKEYIKNYPYSRTKLSELLEADNYNETEIRYALNNCSADWNAFAASRAAVLLNEQTYTRATLIEQLKYEGFTYSQARYAALTSDL